MIMPSVNPPGISPEQKTTAPVPSLGLSSPEPRIGSDTTGAGMGAGVGASTSIMGAIDAESILASEAHAKDYEGEDEYERLIHATLMAGIMDGRSMVAEDGSLNADDGGTDDGSE